MHDEFHSATQARRGFWKEWHFSLCRILIYIPNTGAFICTPLQSYYHYV